KTLVEEAVQRRLVSDVPLGCFLSGGIDSSIVTACAAKHIKQLNTYSIGYKDETYFDETKYANLVANKFGTNHTVFSVSNDEMFEHIHDILDYIDEPFADSSAIAVYILSKKTRQKVTVALSGDGGDELFAGYNKHKAELMMRRGGLLNSIVKATAPVWSALPQSRHGGVGNLFRKLHRYADASSQSEKDRYWRLCSLLPQQHALPYIKNISQAEIHETEQRKQKLLEGITAQGDINDVLYTDMKMVLPGDMLTKVDLMSMANSLEVRVPLLDYTVVNYAFSLPQQFKSDGTTGKKILKEAFADVLPAELFTRPKHGFEVPLRKWLLNGLHNLIENELLSKDYIINQGIFNAVEVEALKKQLRSNNPGDAHATIWALVVFQHWYKRLIK
ncbi:MAG: asparagine synthase C-terminal domain-containing protein, partial [Bacteroidetes bacterium]|nr:asparagine synthase C-terminal domain-containing protein [Bacteroidota bacterium]